MGKPARQHRFRRWGALALAAGLLFSACGDDDDSATTDTTAAEAGGGEGSEGGEGGDDAGIQEAREVTEQYLSAPVGIGITEPIEGEVPEGLKVILISCGVQACDDLGLSMADAAEVLGWEVETIRTDGTPEDLQRAFDQAIEQQPFGITYQAIPAEVIGRQLEAAREAGIHVFPCCVFSGEELYDGTIIGLETHERYGKVNAATLVAAGGPGSNFGQVCLTTITSIEILCDNFAEEVERLCPDCTTTRLDLTIPQLGAGEAPQRIVSFLRSNPDIERLWITNDDFTTGLLPALQTAGLTEVRLHGFATNLQSLELVRSGQMESSFPAPQVETAWYYMDGFARLAAGVSLDPTIEAGNELMPNQLWTADQSVFVPELSGSNIPDGVPTDDNLLPIAPVETLRSEFAALWGR